MLGTEHFTVLFARKITFSAVKEPLDAFLASEAADTAAARAAILAAAERTEIAQACIDTIRSQPVGRALYYQATLTGQLGAVDCEGIADVLDVVRRPDQMLDITVIDIKASRRTSVSFCLQIAFYARLLTDAL